MTVKVGLSASAKLKKDEAKRQLLASMQAKRKVVTEKLEQFMRNDTHDQQDYVALAQELIEQVDSVLDENDYESSLFLSNTVRPLKEMRENAATLLAQLEAHDAFKNNAAPALEKDNVAVYVLVFQQNGHDLTKWAQLLRGLGRYVLGRPIYASEEDVRKVIRVKMTEDHEGYVKVGVAKSALEKCVDLSPRSDRYGNALLTLPAGAVSSQHILEFVHGKKRYHFIEGELIDVSVTTKRN